jgi:hypothetical protein
MRLLQLDIGRADYASPLFRVVSDKSSEISGRTRKRLTSNVSKPLLHLGIGEG